MAAKFPNIKDIAWGRIRQVRVTTDEGKNSYSFEFDLDGRRQKMTITIGADSTAYTLSTSDGNPVLHGMQKGREFKVLDFSSRPSISGAAGKLKKIGKIRKN